MKTLPCLWMLLLLSAVRAGAVTIDDELEAHGVIVRVTQPTPTPGVGTAVPLVIGGPPAPPATTRVVCAEFCRVVAPTGVCACAVIDRRGMAR